MREETLPHGPTTALEVYGFGSADRQGRPDKVVT